MRPIDDLTPEEIDQHILRLSMEDSLSTLTSLQKDYLVTLQETKRHGIQEALRRSKERATSKRLAAIKLVPATPLLLKQAKETLYGANPDIQMLKAQLQVSEAQKNMYKNMLNESTEANAVLNAEITTLRTAQLGAWIDFEKEPGVSVDVDPIVLEVTNTKKKLTLFDAAKMFPSGVLVSPTPPKKSLLTRLKEFFQ